ncbi:sugar ABC transporter substrate-binding protein [Paenibacillus lentus]|uniref:sugar ABC transporter substrate-binding protein n=1 Tax=Paenibacillus lentus TaxID=1338368 RepID=UPI0036657FB8
MKYKFMKTLIISLLAVILVATGCSTGGGTNKGTDEGSSKSAGEKKVVVEGLPDAIKSKDNIKLMVVRKIGGDDHTAQFLAGAKQEGESMGITVDTFTANGDTARFHDAILQAVDKNYDGIIISHGDDAATVDEVKMIVDKGIPVVTFDSNPDLKNIPGVTLTSQDDEALAKLTLDNLIKEKGENAKIIYLWVDGFPPMVRRNNVYQEVLKQYPGIVEIERFGVAAGDTSVQTQNAVSAMLTKHKKGEIDAVFAAWDAFAIGATRAIKEAGRDEIQIYGIDVSNSDLQLLQMEGSPWVSTAAVDPQMIGAVNVRILLNKIAGEETPQTYDLEASLITQEKLKESTEPVNMVNLSEVVPGWGKTDAFLTDWMKALKDAYKK